MEIGSQVAVAICIFTQAKEILLLKRAKKKLKGWWEAPGGWVRKDESPIDAALREVREETGLELKKGRLRFVKAGKNPDGTLVINFAVRMRGKPRLRLRKREHSSYDWFKIEELPKRVLPLPIDYAISLLFQR
jgi:8-oxo-dGTP pyrophosphatase MutT (NUDIX family)